MMRKGLIEVALLMEAINREIAWERPFRVELVSTLHLWQDRWTCPLLPITCRCKGHQLCR